MDRRGCKRRCGQLEKGSPKTLLHQCNPILHQCNPLLHQCSRRLIHIHQITFCTPRRSTLGNFEVSGRCSIGSLLTIYKPRKSLRRPPAPGPPKSLEKSRKVFFFSDLFSRFFRDFFQTLGGLPGRRRQEGPRDPCSAVWQRGRERKGPPEIISESGPIWSADFPMTPMGRTEHHFLGEGFWNNIRRPLLLPAPLFYC